MSFCLQKFVTFGDNRIHRHILASQFEATLALVVWNFVFSIDVAKLLEGHLPAVVSRTLALGITTIWNFYLYKTRIFKSAAEELIG
jgi:putative flippase GtrA